MTSTTTAGRAPSTDRSAAAPAALRTGRRGSPGGWIFSGTNSLWKTDDRLKELIHTGPSIPDRLKTKGYNHIGDIDVVGKIIYVPLEEPATRRASR